MPTWTWMIRGVSHTMTEIQLEKKLRHTALRMQKTILNTLRARVSPHIDHDVVQEATDRVIRNLVSPKYYHISIKNLEGFLYVRIRNRLIYVITRNQSLAEIDETTDVQNSSTYDNDMVSDHFDESNCFKRYGSLHRNRMNAFRLKYMFKYGSSVDDLILLFGLRDDTKGRNLASQKKKRLVEHYTKWLFNQYAADKGLLFTPGVIRAHVKDILYGGVATPVTKDYNNWILKHCI